MTRNKEQRGTPAKSGSPAQSGTPAPAAKAPLDPVIKRRIIIVCLAAAVGGFLFGYDTSVINGAVDSIAGSRTGW
ncbi:hypothetical protein QP223_10950, partial [Streptococcus agalactiae]|nr:hypothetical protein [Streptococcus agalactiae]